MMQDEDVFRILVTTDNHLGYNERDAIRGEDSFCTFEEVLQIGFEKKVDLIIQGGDMFHENRPSRNCLHKTMCLLRKYCLGDKKTAFKILSDEKKTINSHIHIANSSDPNLRVSMPMFCIHGNHDDPSGNEHLSILDVFHAAGLLTYFGKQDRVDDLKLYPLLLKKGRTLISLYGIGNMRDERLNKTFKNKNVKIYRPSEDPEDWFNILVIHQNRYQHGSPSNHIPENFLSNFLNVVIWGHEHDCQITPIKNAFKGFDVIQPGAPIVTSLTKKEMSEKFVCILEVHKTSYSFKKIPLKTPRPFIFDEIFLDDDSIFPFNTENSINFFKNKVESLISSVQYDTQLSPIPSHNIPIVRLKIFYSKSDIPVHPQVFGKFVEGKVANPRDVLLYTRKASPSDINLKIVSDETDVPSHNDAVPSIEDLIKERLKMDALEVIPESEFGEAVKSYVDKEDNHSINDFLQTYLSKIKAELNDFVIDTDLNINYVDSKIINASKVVSKVSYSVENNSNTHNICDKSVLNIKSNSSPNKCSKSESLVDDSVMNTSSYRVFDNHINDSINDDDDAVTFSNYK